MAKNMLELIVGAIGGLDLPVKLSSKPKIYTLRGDWAKEMQEMENEQTRINIAQVKLSAKRERFGYEILDELGAWGKQIRLNLNNGTIEITD